MSRRQWLPVLVLALILGWAGSSHAAPALVLKLWFAGEPAKGAAPAGQTGPVGWKTAAGQPLRLDSFAGGKVDALQRALNAKVSRAGEPSDSINALFTIHQDQLPEVTVYYS